MREARSKLGLLNGRVHEIQQKIDECQTTVSGTTDLMEHVSSLTSEEERLRQQVYYARRLANAVSLVTSRRGASELLVTSFGGSVERRRVASKALALFEAGSATSLHILVRWYIAARVRRVF